MEQIGTYAVGIHDQGVSAMSVTIRQNVEPAIMTIGALISELCRWPDHAAVTFRCPFQQQELRFCRIQNGSKGAVEIELYPTRESMPR
jgi:hypothetical protein